MTSYRLILYKRRWLMHGTHVSARTATVMRHAAERIGTCRAKVYTLRYQSFQEVLVGLLLNICAGVAVPKTTQKQAGTCWAHLSVHGGCWVSCHSFKKYHPQTSRDETATSQLLQILNSATEEVSAETHIMACAL